MMLIHALAIALSLAWQPPRIDEPATMPPPPKSTPAVDRATDMRPFYVGAVVVATIALLLWNRRRKLELERDHERDRERTKRDADADDLHDAARRADDEGRE